MIRGRSYGGSVRALEPLSGKVLWADGLPNTVFGAVAGSGGLIVIADSDGGLYVLAGKSGQILYSTKLEGRTDMPWYPAILATPTIAGRSLFVATTDGIVHAFVFSR